MPVLLFTIAQDHMEHELETVSIFVVILYGDLNLGVFTIQLTAFLTPRLRTSPE